MNTCTQADPQEAERIGTEYDKGQRTPERLEDERAKADSKPEGRG